MGVFVRMTETAILEIDRVVKKYGNLTALHGITVGVKPGEFIALVGPSGSGKSTLLKAIAGFEEISEGRIAIDNVDMNGVSPAHRPTSMVFQKLALFPHKTIAENISFPLKLKKVGKAETEQRVDAMMDLMSLKTSYKSRFPHQLSGGEQQRVALARSMVSNPTLLLLDEPLSALDVKLKKVLQTELKRLHRELGVTFVHVTHDLEEALMLADRICVMNHGRLEQIGTPYEIYYRPATSFVAGFISQTNLLEINVTSVNEAGINFGCAELGAATHSLPRNQCAADIAVGEAKLMVRPERLQPIGTRKNVHFTTDVTVAEYFIKGSTVQYMCHSNIQDNETRLFEIRGQADLPYDVKDIVSLGFNSDEAFAFNEPNLVGR